MNWSIIFQVIVGALISAFIAIAFVMWMENLRKPKLAMIIDTPVDAKYPANRPAKIARYLSLVVENKELPWFAKWLSRNAAVHCQGVITFHHLDGQNIFGRSMRARWPASPEPVPIQAFAPGPVAIQILDPVRLSPEIYMDIHSGESERLNVAARFDKDVECYGWCNDNYFSNPVWRNPDWRMGAGRYIVKVDIISSAVKSSGLFRLINDVPMSDFRLENALPEDYRKVDL